MIYTNIRNFIQFEIDLKLMTYETGKRLDWEKREVRTTANHEILAVK